MKERDGVVIVPDFLSPETVELYTEEISKLPRRDIQDHLYDKFIQLGESAVLRPLMDGLNLKVREFIENYYSCGVGQEELASLVSALPGWELQLHADTFEDTSLNLDTYAGYPSRDISTLLYFNNHGSDFTGGDLFMPNQDLFIFPKAGMLVAFPTSEKYLHQVAKVESGERLNITTFWHVLERFDSTRYV